MLYSYRYQEKDLLYFLHAGEHPTLDALNCLDALPGFELLGFYGEDLMAGLANQSFKSASEFSDFLWGQIESYDDFFFLEMDCSFSDGDVIFFGQDNLEFTFGCDESKKTDAFPVFIEFMTIMMNLDNSALGHLQASIELAHQNPNIYLYFNRSFELVITFTDFDEYLEYYDSM